MGCLAPLTTEPHDEHHLGRDGMVPEPVDNARQGEDVEGAGHQTQHDAPAHQRQVELKEDSAHH